MHIHLNLSALLKNWPQRVQKALSTLLMIAFLAGNGLTAVRAESAHQEPSGRPFSDADVQAVLALADELLYDTHSLSKGAALFIENTGQVDERVLYLGLAQEQVLWLLRDGFWLTYRNEGASIHLRLGLSGANPQAQVSGLGAWMAGDQPGWDGVHYADLYPGVDLRIDTQADGFAYRLLARDAAAEAALGAVQVQAAAGDPPQVIDHYSLQKPSVQLVTGQGTFELPRIQVLQNVDHQTSAGVTAQVDPLGSISKIVAGWEHTCALTDTGGVKCWGRNEYGQLGDGTTSAISAPVSVNGLSSGVTALAAGYSHTCALTDTGGVKCWGNNGTGQLGDGTTTNRHTPVDVSGLSSGVAALTAGGNHTCALTSLGAVKCWGSNGYGELGDGTNIDQHTPVDVSGLSSGVAALGVGPATSGHTCALTDSGGVKCWGLNNYGQLGNGTTTWSSVPVNVSGLSSGVTMITLGGWHTCAVTGTGGAKCWGSNLRGQLGNGLYSQRSIPLDVNSLSSGVASLSAGNNHTCTVTTAGGTKCWGDNDNGQLGDGTTTWRSTPMDVSGLSSGAALVAAGNKHTCALTVVGGVKCWGVNWYGQLGDGTTTSQTTPVDVLGSMPINYNVDLGFHPNPDGYQFENYGGVNLTDLTIADMREMFGDEAVCATTTPTCIPKWGALKWWGNLHLTMIGGHCFGMAVTSLRFFINDEEPQDFESSAATTYQLQKPPSTGVRRFIANYHSRQFTYPAMDYHNTELLKTLPEILEQLRAAISSGMDPYILVLYYEVGPLGYAGHAVTPYAIETVNAGIFHVKVYDNAWPDDESRSVEINTNNNTWSYDFGGETGIRTGSAGTLFVAPISLYNQPSQCRWCEDSGNPTALIWPQGDGNLFVENSQGDRLGVQDGQPLQEIAGGYLVPIIAGTEPAQPMLVVPANAAYTYHLSGETLTETGQMSVDQFSPGQVLSVEDIPMSPTSRVNLLVAADSRAVTFEAAADPAKVNLKLITETTGLSQQVAFEGLHIENGGQLTAQLLPDQQRVKIDGSLVGAGQYAYNVDQITATDTLTYQRSAIPLLAADTHYLSTDLTSADQHLVLEIDSDSDGDIDETKTLRNQKWDGPVFLSQKTLNTTAAASPLLLLSGTRPTPCDIVQTYVGEPDASGRIDVDVYTRHSSGRYCIQMTAPFEQTVSIENLAAGSYTVWVNGEQVGALQID